MTKKHGEDIHLLEEGDLGGGGDELQGEAPHAHRGPHVGTTSGLTLGY